MAGESGLAATSGVAEHDLVRPVSLPALFIAFSASPYSASAAASCGHAVSPWINAAG
jgi:hypothetical protein